MCFTNAVWAVGRIGSGALRFNGEATGEVVSRAWVSNTNYRLLPQSGLFSLSFWLSPDQLRQGWSGLAGSDVDGDGGWSVALQNAGPGTNYLVFAGDKVASSLSVTGRTLLLPG